MREVLRPYTDFDTDELATYASELVKQSQRYLKRRRLIGVIARYGADLDTAKRKIEKGQHETAEGSLSHFAVIRPQSGEVRGFASIFPGFKLLRSRLPINPRLLPSSLVDTDYIHANPNISAWETDGGELLADAYSELRAMSQPPIPSSGIRNIPWTVEPVTAPRYVHKAIEISGMERINTRFYNDGEPWSLVVPSVLYEAPLGHLTASGRLNELRTGNWYGSEEEIMSRSQGT